jgi:hypothetical protein
MIILGFLLKDTDEASLKVRLPQSWGLGGATSQGEYRDLCGQGRRREGERHKAKG